MCTDNDPAYTSSMWFRGKQVTDAFIVTVDGKSTLTSQFVFDDALDDEIIATQPIYKSSRRSRHDEQDRRCRADRQARCLRLQDDRDSK
jgi:hypothetical protein